MGGAGFRGRAGLRSRPASGIGPAASGRALGRGTGKRNWGTKGAGLEERGAGGRGRGERVSASEEGWIGGGAKGVGRG